jgi:hypothetical protein
VVAADVKNNVAMGDNMLSQKAQFPLGVSPPAVVPELTRWITDVKIKSTPSIRFFVV